MIDFRPFYQQIATTNLSAWLETLPLQLKEWEKQTHGDYAKWSKIVDFLPDLQADTIDLKNAVKSDRTSPLSEGEKQRIVHHLKQLMPWRKGPYHLFDIHVDCEWRSDFKWDRVLPHLAPLKDRTILDVGCGEGFYARQIQQRTERNIFAFDLSREAIQIASKKDKRKAVKWFVTDLSKIPLKDGSMDCILDIFSPAHYKEFQRLLSPNGYVVKVIPTKNHLREIRTKVQAHLKNPDYSNESVVEYFEKYLKTISRETVSATVQLSSEQRMSFIEMTPLLFCVEKDCVDWRTLTHLTIEADVLIGMY